MKKRVWTWILAIACVIALVVAIPAKGQALTLTAPGGTIEVPTQTNPRYPQLREAEDRKSVAVLTTNSDPLVPERREARSWEAAAKEIRKLMIERSEYFIVQVTVKENAGRDDIEELFNMALEHTGGAREGDYLAWQFAEWSGSLRSFPLGMSQYTHEFTYRVSYYTTAEQEKQVDAAVSQILKQLNVGSKSNYDKIKAVYDHLCANVVYDNDNLENEKYTLKYTAYAAAVDKKAVCQGYALLMYRLLLELGVDNRVITGISGEESHAWNIVKIGNLYYNVDATWDAGTTDYQFFLRNTENFTDHWRYLEYETLDFHNDYPISATDYVPGGTASAETVVVRGDCGENVRWELTRDGALSIIGTGAIKDYAYGSNDITRLAPWRIWADEIKKLTVGEGITEIGDNAFCELPNLTTASLPSTLKRIGEGAFLSNSKLKTAAIPSGVTTIEESAFRGCTVLAGISIPSGLKSLEGQAFAGCGALTTVTIPDGIKTIGHSCFNGCTGLKTVIFNTELEEIELRVFAGCGALEKLELPQSLKKIGEKAFEGCEALKEVTIPSGVTEIVWGAFEDCFGLKKVVFKGSPSVGMDAFECAEGSRVGSVERFYFESDPPLFHVRAFSGVKATCYYPKDNAKWTQSVMQNYSGTITWVVSCGDDHVPVKDAAVKQGCAKTGLTEGSHCSACGEVLVAQQTIPADGHKYGPWTQVKAPSIQEKGKEQRKCSVCGDVQQRDIPKLPETPTQPPTQPPTTPPTQPPTEGQTEPATEPATNPEPTAGPAAPAPTQADDGEEREEMPRNDMVIILIAGVVVLAACGGTAWLLISRKRR